MDESHAGSHLWNIIRLGIAYSLRLHLPSFATETLMMEKSAPFPTHLLISAVRVIGTNRGARSSDPVGKGGLANDSRGEFESSTRAFCSFVSSSFCLDSWVILLAF
ncbi:hypothetical protein NPIL_92161 [Nephila pilipes]|uniref:Uncharacterized protein n=1 Tax=Nephila pilipes TaxID=299642 RepID=A0A8X6P6E0_NEPPI|nr:hypothetical protein NPIL_92161 [Nephila pilipes]